MNRTAHWIASSLLLVGLAFPTLSRAEPPPPLEEEVEAPRGEVMDRIRLVRMYALTEALELDEATAAQLFPYLRAGDTRREELHATKRGHRKALREMVRDEAFPKKAVDRHLAALARVDVQLAEVAAEQLEGLKKILTDDQRVKFVMVRAKLEHEVRRMLGDERRRRRGEGRRGAEGDRKGKGEGAGRGGRGP